MVVQSHKEMFKNILALAVALECDSKVTQVSEATTTVFHGLCIRLLKNKIFFTVSAFWRISSAISCPL